MLPIPHQIAFSIFALIILAIGARGFFRVYARIRAGAPDTDLRFDRLPSRIVYAVLTTLTQSRTFRKRPVISLFHSFIFYGFVFYILVNFVDGLGGFLPFSVSSTTTAGATYNLVADLLSALVLIGVVALVIRRFLLPSRRDFRFNDRTLLHPAIARNYIRADSLVVSAFILFHVGSRAIGAGAKLAQAGPDRFQPFASFLSRVVPPSAADSFRTFGYWGALGSVLAFLMYFPFSKHIHIFLAPAKYLVVRRAPSGVLPAVHLDLDTEAPRIGAHKLEDLAWPRLLDAYACIQCNRCQDVCPATATGKSLSPSALEINKRMELNALAKSQPDFATGAPSPHPLLAFALSPEAAWACTTCGACLDVCPVHDEPMLDIIDIRRNQVMIQGDFPTQLQSAFRGMERAKNPWGMSHETRMDWARGLPVKTIDDNPDPDVLYWVGCAASYDPQSQKTARAFVQLLDHAGVNFSVLGKQECCTGDSARRAGNELLYQQLADQNISRLNNAKPKLIVATCPHCMNSIGKEYAQRGGNYKVVHHTEYLESLVTAGKLSLEAGPVSATYHDPCYLGRHNGVYDAPRNLLHVLSNTITELDRTRENSFCCGAGGAQFWKEEEPGTERISDNRYREARQTLGAQPEKVLAVGCPFCKSMLESTPGKSDSDGIAIRDIAELMLDSVQRKLGISALATAASAQAAPTPIVPIGIQPATPTPQPVMTPGRSALATPAPVRQKWIARPSAPSVTESAQPSPDAESPAPVKRKTWAPKPTAKPPENSGS